MPRTDRVTLKSPVTLTFDKLTSSTIGQLFTDIGSLLDVERSNILSLQIDVRATQSRRRGDVLGAHMGKFMLRREGRHNIVAYSGDGENEVRCVITHASEFKEFWRTALPNLGVPGSFEYSVQHVIVKADRIRTNPLSEHILRVETHTNEIIDARTPSAPSVTQQDVAAPELLSPNDQPTLPAEAEFPIADEPTPQEEGLPEGSRYFDNLQAVRDGILQTFDDLDIKIDGTVNLYFVDGEDVVGQPLILERKGGKPNRAMLHTDKINSELLHDVPSRVNIDDVRYRNIFNKLIEELATRMNVEDLQFLVTTETL